MPKQNARKKSPAIEELMSLGQLSCDAYDVMEEEGVIIEAEKSPSRDPGSSHTYLIFESSDRGLTVRLETFFDEEEGAETSVDDILDLARKELGDALESLDRIPELGV